MSSEESTAVKEARKKLSIAKKNTNKDCAGCGQATNGKLKCSSCISIGAVVCYCSSSCQKVDWKNGHKQICGTARVLHKQDLEGNKKKDDLESPDELKNIMSPKICLIVAPSISKLTLPFLVAGPVWNFEHLRHVYGNDGSEKSHATKQIFYDMSYEQKKFIKKSVSQSIKQFFKIRRTGQAETSRADFFNFGIDCMLAYHLGVDGISLLDPPPVVLLFEGAPVTLCDQYGNLFDSKTIALEKIVFDSPPQYGWYRREVPPNTLTYSFPPGVQMGPFGKVVAQIKMMEEHVWTRKINASYDAPKKELKLKEGTDYDIKSTGELKLTIDLAKDLRIRFDGRVIIKVKDKDTESILLQEYFEALWRALPQLSEAIRGKITKQYGDLVYNAWCDPKESVKFASNFTVSGDQVMAGYGVTLKQFTKNIPYLSKKQRKAFRKSIRKHAKGKGRWQSERGLHKQWLCKNK